MVARGSWKENGELVSNGKRIGDEVLEADGWDGLYHDVNALMNCVHKNDKVLNFMLCVLYHNLKQKVHKVLRSPKAL